jgi:hypothetical protein
MLSWVSLRQYFYLFLVGLREDKNRIVSALDEVQTQVLPGGSLQINRHTNLLEQDTGNSSWKRSDNWWE